MTLGVPAVVVGPFLLEKFQLVGLTPPFSHLLCAHMVPMVLGCGGRGSVLLPLWLHFQLRIERASYNCSGETQLCPAVLLLLFLEYICCNRGNDPWPYLCTIHLDPMVPNFSYCWLEMNDYLCSRWCKRSCIEIEQAMELCMCREGGIYSVCPNKVQCDNGLGQ